MILAAASYVTYAWHLAWPPAVGSGKQLLSV
jgi:hypothetical protein